MDLGRWLGFHGSEEGDLPVRRRADLGKGYYLALVQMEVDVDQFDADAPRDAMLVQEPFQVVEILLVSLSRMLHVMDEGEPVVRSRWEEVVLDQSHGIRAMMSVCVYVQGRGRDFVVSLK